MLTIQDVNRAIMLQDWTNTELASMIDAIKCARAHKAKQVKRSLSIGDNVNFNNSKTGQNMTGAVTKIAIKYITVRTVTGLWRVPASILTVVDEATA